MHSKYRHHFSSNTCICELKICSILHWNNYFNEDNSVLKWKAVVKEQIFIHFVLKNYPDQLIFTRYDALAYTLYAVWWVVEWIQHLLFICWTMYLPLIFWFHCIGPFWIVWNRSNPCDRRFRPVWCTVILRHSQKPKTLCWDLVTLW